MTTTPCGREDLTIHGADDLDGAARTCFLKAMQPQPMHARGAIWVLQFPMPWTVGQ